VRVALGYLEKLVLTPEKITAADVQPLRAAGLDDRAIRDVTYICAAFSLIPRVADTLGFNVPSAEQFSQMATLVTQLGYRLRI
jgi:alkylhydroperoxidase family enzyme